MAAALSPQLIGNWLCQAPLPGARGGPRPNRAGVECRPVGVGEGNDWGASSRKDKGPYMERLGRGVGVGVGGPDRRMEGDEDNERRQRANGGQRQGAS